VVVASAAWSLPFLKALMLSTLKRPQSPNSRGPHAAGRTGSRLVALGTLLASFAREIVAAQSPRQRAETVRELVLWRRVLGPRFIVVRLGAREWQAFIRQRQTGEIDARGRRVASATRRPVRARTVAKSLRVLRQACRFGTGSRDRNGAFLLDTDPTRGLPPAGRAEPAAARGRF
jgi:hypothetical protein